MVMFGSVSHVMRILKDDDYVLLILEPQRLSGYHPSLQSPTQYVDILDYICKTAREDSFE
jgi:hypothetical protein